MNQSICDKLEQLSHRLTNKFLHAPTQALSQAADGQDELQALVSRLFHLHGETGKHD